jgi:hypothetical protein
MKKYFYDYLGIMGSGLCLVHCLATPILLITQPYFQGEKWGITPENQYWDYLFLLVCFVAVFTTTKHLESSKIVMSFWTFFLFFSIAILFEDDFKYLNYLGYGSSIGLIITHLINIKHCKRCQTKSKVFPLN